MARNKKEKTPAAVANGSPMPSKPTTDENLMNSDSATTPDNMQTTRSRRFDILAARAARRDVIKVNNANLTELKHTCDDELKTLLSHKDLFTTIYTHTDVKLGLGWGSVFVALGTALYGWKVEFEKSKPLVWAGVILYCVLTAIQTAYSYFVEGDIVYTGRRKTLAKRIETERIVISSKTIPSQPDRPPRYSLSVSYVHSANGGKSLLGRGTGSEEKPYNEFFDENGVLDQDRYHSWVAQLVERVVDGK